MFVGKWVKPLSIISLVAFTLVGCSSAKKASEVSATYIDPAPHMKMECSELFQAAENLRREELSVRGQVDSAYDSDKTAEIVAWLLFAPAAFLIDGNAEEQAKLASILGQRQAVSTAVSVNKCNSKNNNESAKSSSDEGQGIVERLEQLKDLRARDIISEEEYALKKQALLEDL